jgi:hypothetical protein
MFEPALLSLGINSEGEKHRFRNGLGKIGYPSRRHNERYASTCSEWSLL